uniref:Uncharacterized protein n=1 Tax=Anopheles darlingi TaxID=43151 RepID=A0A2M4D4U0_ANODA
MFCPKLVFAHPSFLYLSPFPACADKSIHVTGNVENSFCIIALCSVSVCGSVSVLTMIYFCPGKSPNFSLGQHIFPGFRRSRGQTESGILRAGAVVCSVHIHAQNMNRERAYNHHSIPICGEICCNAQ